MPTGGKSESGRTLVSMRRFNSWSRLNNSSKRAFIAEEEKRILREPYRVR